MGFIPAAAGSAVALGNIWKFPYQAGENGGAVFLIIYRGFILTIGLSVMLPAERRPLTKEALPEKVISSSPTS
ncbi:MAG: hypothetical protein JKY68_08810 [Rhodospirillales bacterium]|nr:hypothetical protein [Rhodospirillales bacterium]